MRDIWKQTYRNVKYCQQPPEARRELPTLQPQPEASGEKPSSTSSSDPGDSSPTPFWLCKLRGHQKRRVNAGQDAASGRRQGWKDQGERIREGIKPSGTQREKIFPFTCQSQWLMKVSRPRLYRAESDSRSSSCRLNGLHEELTVQYLCLHPLAANQLLGPHHFAHSSPATQISPLSQGGLFLHVTARFAIDTILPPTSSHLISDKPSVAGRYLEHSTGILKICGDFKVANLK
ncbi:uncharacterized protein LOC125174467 [Prionailurus viverrinus]|uniref:uncharacterized protein LOC125174467 n=1 Tax=Prionailurus viverrinus TaxID=61388 RepID=UPI001FF49DC1|nr:uncharacterized protein LOC125174467 [Prionailurus viverrinus]